MRQELLNYLRGALTLYLIQIMLCIGTNPSHADTTTDGNLYVSQSVTNKGNVSLPGDEVSVGVTEPPRSQTQLPSTTARAMPTGTQDSSETMSILGNTITSPSFFPKTRGSTFPNNSSVDVLSSTAATKPDHGPSAAATSPLSDSALTDISASTYHPSTINSSEPTLNTTTQNTDNYTVNSSPKSSSREDALSAKLDNIYKILIIFCVTVVVLLLVCLVLVGSYMAVMSRRYRDITNELFTLRKMKIHRRISRRETQREDDEIKINLEPPGRRLRHTQSVHGYADKPPRPPSYDMVDRPRSFLVDRPAPPIDPNNYIICKHNSVSSNRSPSRASESDTVQSEC